MMIAGFELLHDWDDDLDDESSRAENFCYKSETSRDRDNWRMMPILRRERDVIRLLGPWVMRLDCLVLRHKLQGLHGCRKACCCRTPGVTLQQGTLKDENKAYFREFPFGSAGTLGIEESGSDRSFLLRDRKSEASLPTALEIDLPL